MKYMKKYPIIKKALAAFAAAAMLAGCASPFESVPHGNTYTESTLEVVTTAAAVTESLSDIADDPQAGDPQSVTETEAVTSEETVSEEITAEMTEEAVSEETSEETADADSAISDTETEITEETIAEEAVPEETAAEKPDVKFRSKKLLNQHYEKHGKEMGFSSAKEYEAAAAEVVNSPDALHKTEAEDGDDIYYIEATNEFVVVSTDGYIRTYFNPSGGKKYYDRQ